MVSVACGLPLLGCENASSSQDGGGSEPGYEGGAASAADGSAAASTTTNDLTAASSGEADHPLDETGGSAVAGASTDTGSGSGRDELPNPATTPERQTFALSGMKRSRRANNASALRVYCQSEDASLGQQVCRPRGRSVVGLLRMDGHVWLAADGSMRWRAVRFWPSNWRRWPRDPGPLAAAVVSKQRTNPHWPSTLHRPAGDGLRSDAPVRGRDATDANPRPVPATRNLCTHSAPSPVVRVDLLWSRAPERRRRELRRPPRSA